MKTAFTATSARTHFFKLLAQASRPGGALTITLEGEPKVIMMSAEEFEGWQETLEIMSDKELMRDLRKALREKKFFTPDEAKKKLGLA